MLLQKINADDETAADANRVDDESSNLYVPPSTVAHHTDSYANYYANWTPELYQQYGLPQEYYQTYNKKPLRKQDSFTELMSDVDPVRVLNT